ncbi:exonuclease domain-containing protein [Corynebacterium caspium]|uniref:exonuclease domain-containing protein n=1 Tax=Corynebacterium caspium TaxID=234828 RepID=UPI0003649DB0|nr:exonuclease domain-containing protein [Corynebacterium caspium]WKD59025.1 DNA polymerase III PolC-type [Corynebacterium caspium DSM 44850]
MFVAYPAYGARLIFRSGVLHVDNSPLITALRGARETEIPLDSIKSFTFQAPGILNFGTLDILGSAGEILSTIKFAPTKKDQAQAFISALELALKNAATGSETEIAAQLPFPELSNLKDSIPGLNFVAFNIDTANSNRGSIYQIGVVKFIDGLEVDAKSWICQPPAGLEGFAPFNTETHGFTAADLVGKPKFIEILPEFLAFIGNLPLLAHNAAFDLGGLQEATLVSNTAAKLPKIEYGCTLLISRQRKHGGASNSLDAIATALSIDSLKDHDALADSRATGQILTTFARQDKFQGNLAEFFHSRGFELGVLEGEILSPVLATATPKPENKPESSKPAGKYHSWKAVSAPKELPTANPNADPNNPLFGQIVVLTGDFTPYQKEEIFAAIADYGGTPKKSVTLKTTILIVGAWESITGNEKKARKYQERGQNIAIWPAQRLYDLIGFTEHQLSNPVFSEQPPF